MREQVEYSQGRYRFDKLFTGQPDEGFCPPEEKVRVEADKTQLDHRQQDRMWIQAQDLLVEIVGD